MNFNIKKIVPHIIVVVLFGIIASLYFYPVIQGKKMWQSDIVQYTGMAKQQNDFRKDNGEEPYWTDSAFIGMATYQLGANYPHNYIKKLDKLLRFLPRPADYLFLYLIGFYILMMVLGARTGYAVLGSLAFGLSTYLIIILGAGHNAKAHAIAYFPMVLAGILLVFQKKYIIGFLFSIIALGLEIVTNHFQMTYYLLLLVIVMGIVYLVDAYKKKELPHFFKSVGILSVAAIFALLLNATNLMATKQYANESTRSKSELTVHADGSPKEASNGLSKEYITEYSYGIAETFNLLIPRFMGGSGSEAFDEEGKFMKFLRSSDPEEAQLIYRNTRMYWGDQPIIAAPAYIGAVILFLFVIALFMVRGRFKVWVIAGILLTLILSWGKNLAPVTNFFIDYVPLYDKFRAVSSIQVIIEFMVPVFAIIGLIKFISETENNEKKLKVLKWSTYILGGLCLLFLILGTSIFKFKSINDPFLDYPEIMRPLIEDRKTLFINDTFRSLIFILLTAGLLFGFIKNMVKEKLLILGVAILLVVDLAGVNMRYVNEDNFVKARRVDMPFQMNSADAAIVQDTSHFRVYDKVQTMSGKPSYFHNAIGGYHAAKPRRFDELYSFYMSDYPKDSLNKDNKKHVPSLLNMLNVKYIIDRNEGKDVALLNPYANGAAWFVKKAKMVESSNEEILGLKDINTKEEIVYQKSFDKGVGFQKEYVVDSLANISLATYAPNRLVYKTQNQNKGLAVFSEMHYPHGWKSYIDGKEVNYHRVNYLLRAVEVPAGEHTIEFKFDPQVVKTGSKVTLASSIIVLLLIIGGLYMQLKGVRDHSIEE